MIENFLFIGLPYIALFLMIGGILYRLFSGFMGSYRGRWDFSARGDFLWSTRSTGFFGRTSIGAASLNIHWGMILLLIAHVVGFVGGLKAMSTFEDYAILVLLIIVTVFGLYQSAVKLVFGPSAGRCLHQGYSPR